MMLATEQVLVYRGEIGALFINQVHVIYAIYTVHVHTGNLRYKINSST